ncbi:MAG: hypothetical protein J2P51_17435 [Hyphomicrobiaceae bacterium]|nr:hypothetical protein [Hyphomicrobiaceae bacterium]
MPVLARATESMAALLEALSERSRDAHARAGAASLPGLRFIPDGSIGLVTPGEIGSHVFEETAE